MVRSISDCRRDIAETSPSDILRPRFAMSLPTSRRHRFSMTSAAISGVMGSACFSASIVSRKSPISAVVATGFSESQIEYKSSGFMSDSYLLWLAPSKSKRTPVSSENIERRNRGTDSLYASLVNNVLSNCTSICCSLLCGIVRGAAITDFGHKKSPNLSIRA